MIARVPGDAALRKDETVRFDLRRDRLQHQAHRGRPFIEGALEAFGGLVLCVIETSAKLQRRVRGFDFFVEECGGGLLIDRGRQRLLADRLEGAVEERTRDLQRANDEIQRFAYIVSHDLRSPLVNIMGFTSELETSVAMLQNYLIGDSGDEKAASDARAAVRDDVPEAVRFIRASTGKMDGLINAILKLSREGRRELNPEPVDLARVFAQAAASLKHQLDDAGAEVSLPASTPRIVTDRLAIEQVVGNVHDNAVKYLASDRPGRIAVSAGQVAGRVRIDIRDNGRGIGLQDRERIFELFRRAGPQDRPGEGIGLAHVRALVRRLGGDITVSSELGRGSTFQIDLPARMRPSETT